MIGRLQLGNGSSDYYLVVWVYADNNNKALLTQAYRAFNEIKDKVVSKY